MTQESSLFDQQVDFVSLTIATSQDDIPDQHLHPFTFEDRSFLQQTISACLRKPTALVPSDIAVAVNRTLVPSLESQGVAEIEGGWQVARGIFTLVVDEHFFGTVLRYTLIGWIDNWTGLVMEDSIFRINSCTKTRLYGEPSSDQTYLLTQQKAVGSVELVMRDDGLPSCPTTREHFIDPLSVCNTSPFLDMGPDLIDTRSMMSHYAHPLSIENSSGPAYLTNLLNALAQAKALGGLLSGEVDTMTVARDYLYVENMDSRKLRSLTSQPAGRFATGTFTMESLLTEFPDAQITRDRREMGIVVPTPNSPAHHQKALMIKNNVMALMTKYSIKSGAFIFKEKLTMENIVTFGGGAGLSDEEVEKFKHDFFHEIVLSHFGYAQFVQGVEVKIQADLAGMMEMVFNEDRKPIRAVFPLFCSALTSPQVVPNQKHQRKFMEALIAMICSIDMTPKEF